MEDYFCEYSESEKIALAALADTKGVDIEQVESDLLKQQLKRTQQHQDRLKVVDFPVSRR